MNTSILLRLIRRLFVILCLAWVIDFLVVQHLSPQNFDAGKQVEIVITLLLAWRYCMPLTTWRKETTQ